MLRDTKNVSLTDTTEPTAAISTNESTVAAGEPIEINGSASTDNVGVTDYNWTFDNGTATDTGERVSYSFDEAGSYEIELEVKDDAGNSAVDTTTVTVEADKGTAAELDGQPTTTTAGEPLDRTLAVTVTDAFDNRVTGENVTVRLNDSSALLGTTEVTTNDSGIAEFDNLLIETADSYTLTFELDSNASVSNTTDAFRIEPADADSVAVDSQPTDTVAGEPTAGPPSVNVTDRFDNPVDSVDVDVTAIDGRGSIESGPTTVETNERGMATFDELKINQTDTTYRLEFTLDDADSNVNVADEATTDPFDVAAADANSVTVETQPDSTQTAGESITADPAVTVTDEFDNPVDSVDVGVTAIDGSGAIESGTTTAETNDSGVATFDDIAIEDADQNYRLQATIDAGEPNVKTSDNVTTDQFDVEAADADSVSVERQPNSTQTAGEVISGVPEVSVTDEFDNPVDGVTVTIAESSGYTFDNGTTTNETTNGLASFDDLIIETAAEDYQLVFSIDDSDENVTQSTDIQTNGFDVVAADFAALTIGTAPSSVTAGESFSLTINATDEMDNPAAYQTLSDFEIGSQFDGTVFEPTNITLNGTGQYVAQISSENVTTANETHTLSVSTDELSTESVDVAVDPVSTHTVELDPNTDQTIDPNDTVGFNATAFDVYGNLVEDNETAFSWRNTTNQGVFDTATAGVYTVTAEFGGVTSDPTAVDVREPADDTEDDESGGSSGTGGQVGQGEEDDGDSEATTVRTEPDTENGETNIIVENPTPSETVVIDREALSQSTDSETEDETDTGDASETDDSPSSTRNIRPDRLSLDVNTTRDFSLQVTTYETDLTRSSTFGSAPPTPSLSASRPRFSGVSAAPLQQTQPGDELAPEEVRQASDSFENETATVSAGYVDISHDLTQAELTGARFEFSIRSSYLDELGVDPHDVELYHRTGEGQWEVRNTEYIERDETHHRFEGTMPDFSVFALGTGAEPIGVTDAGLAASTIDRGEEATISATVANRGQGDAEETVELTVDGETVDDRTVSLEGGETTDIEFGYKPEETGEYSFAVGDTDVGSLTVGDGVESDDDGQSWGWLVVAILVTILVVVILWRRRTE